MKKEDKYYEECEIKHEIKELEQFYVNATAKNLPEVIENRKKEMVKKINEFNENFVEVLEDREGNQRKKVNPLLVSTYFFKPITNMYMVEPDYSPETLSILWGYYMELVEQVNMYIAPFQPTLTHFSKFCGISLSKFQSYRKSSNEGMRILAEKISDECFNSNVSLAQTGDLKETSTLKRIKYENEIVEKKAPNVNINLIEKPDIELINDRIKKYKEFSEKKVSSKK